MLGYDAEGEFAMPVIAEDATFTQVVQFEVEPAKQEALIQAIVTEVDRWVRHLPGFVASNFHASFDGRHVLNYAQWRTEADFRDFTKDPEGERLSQAIRAVGSVSGPQAVHYRVVRCIEPQSPRQETAHG